jgi:phosphatidylinositol glycan class Q protein
MAAVPGYVVRVDGLERWFLLLSGKRFNVLRNRTDTWEYDTDQLLFGTILFTLLTFLFPPVLAYNALFAMVCPTMSTTFCFSSSHLTSCDSA